ncbi:Reverse transcriptase domain [Cinara cedri]|uniref:Reverse transcriptase domain n=1 Tax=Cinara cedri TaxID=506608 RepID=A0A5E4N5Q2_9HEMI|nr:Reverse transcriptase domain [Cinara cedri]
MKEINLDFKDRRIIYNLYKNQSVEIKINNKSASAKIRRGVRQGCPLSPLLFNCYIEKSIMEVKDKLNRLGIGLAETEHDLQRALEEMQIIINKYQMRINSSKTKILVCAREPTINANIYLENQLISQVSSFKYLESLITSDGRSSQAIKQRIGQAKTTFIKKKKILVSKKISRAIKKNFLKTFVWSVTLYGCETWVINEKEKKFPEAFEMWCWKRMEKINWTERVTNEDVLTQVG